jgi:hypothetical protein
MIEERRLAARGVMVMTSGLPSSENWGFNTGVVVVAMVESDVVRVGGGGDADEAFSDVAVEWCLGLRGVTSEI